MEQRRSSIELLLDDRTEEHVRAEWAALADAGLSSLARHDAPSNRPHVTLLARAGLPTDLPLEVALPVLLALGPPILLGTGERRVLARAVIPNAALLALQSRVRRAAGAAPGDGDEHFAERRWVPHVTLARRIRLADVPTALALVGEPIDAHAVALRHWDPETATITVLAGG